MMTHASINQKKKKTNDQTNKLTTMEAARCSKPTPQARPCRSAPRGYGSPSPAVEVCAKRSRFTDTTMLTKNNDE